MVRLVLDTLCFVSYFFIILLATFRRKNENVTSLI
jgi:hypothetical protein